MDATPAAASLGTFALHVADIELEPGALDPATIEVEGGPTLEVGPGDLGILERGARTTWTIHERLRKVFQITLEAWAW